MMGDGFYLPEEGLMPTRDYAALKAEAEAVASRVKSRVEAAWERLYHSTDAEPASVLKEADATTQELYERLMDRLAHAEQFAEASRRAIADARALIAPNEIERWLLAAARDAGRESDAGGGDDG
jgi:hypothetical protein